MYASLWTTFGSATLVTQNLPGCSWRTLLDGGCRWASQKLGTALWSVGSAINLEVEHVGFYGWCLTCLTCGGFSNIELSMFNINSWLNFYRWWCWRCWVVAVDHVGWDLLRSAGKKSPLIHSNVFPARRNASQGGAPKRYKLVKICHSTMVIFSMNW